LCGYLEYSNRPYAIAKIAGIELCNSYRVQFGCNFIAAMPTNLYGTNDNYHPENSHVLPALVRRIILAKKNNESEVTIWGTGTPLREFLHVDDLADACYFLLLKYNEDGFINIGSGKELTIKELAEFISKKVGYNGIFRFDESMPDGTPRKLLDIDKITKLGWSPKISLSEGLNKTILEYKNIFNNL
jgi:GDP-L-fucose synthase